jgi:putative transposase
MESDSTTISSDATLFTGEAWFDPIEAGLRGRVRGFIEDLIEQELAAALGRGRYERLSPQVVPAGEPDRAAPPAAGHRHGHRSRRIMGSFGAVEIAVPRARMVTPEGVTAEWRSEALPRYARRTRQVEALIAGAYLAGTNTRRIRRALAALFAGAVSKDIVSRTWRKVKSDWDAWCRRSLTDEDIVRLILDGTVLRVRLDRKPVLSLSKGRPASRCWSCSASDVTGRRSCCRCATLAVRAKRPGAPFSTTSSPGACEPLSS